MSSRIILAILACLLPASAGDRKPNLIFILADDLGYGEVGAFGQKLIATPNLDRMAAEGMRFTRFYAGSTVCAPSRSVLMTGQHTGHTRVRGNAGKANPLAQQLLAKDVTVAEVLKSSGYATALIGKWGLGEEGTEGVPNRQGFDYFYGYLNQLHAHNPYPAFLWRNEERVPLRNETEPTSADGERKEMGGGYAKAPLDYAPDLMAGEALKWVEDQKEKPFFLYWSFITPHANNEGNKVERGQEVPDLGEYKAKPWPLPDRAHAATITRFDADIGRLFALLKKLNLDENTLVIFSSDNGHHQEAMNHPELFAASGPFRGLKRSLTDGGVHVPMIASWPGTTPAGTTTNAVSWFADVLPTFAELAHTKTEEVPSPIDGISLAGILKGRTPPSGIRAPLYWEFHENGFSQALLIDERWKAIRLGNLQAPIEIYDTQNDIGETKNLAAEQPEIVARAKELFLSCRTESEQWRAR